jgi:hypothetical protein
MPTTGFTSGRVFIWYPNKGNIGHASLYLGNYAIGQKFEMTLNQDSPDYRPWKGETDEQIAELDKVHYNDNYVSWWPDKTTYLVLRVPSNASLGLYNDVELEDSEPHVVYDLFGLDLPAMRQCWHAIRDKPEASYHLTRKNCADIVMRVLVAGGVKSRLPSAMSAAWFTHNAYTAPKDVAQLCNKLRDEGWAIKTKAANCPGKLDTKPHLLLAGLR